jgi:hypothetical protein
MSNVSTTLILLNPIFQVLIILDTIDCKFIAEINIDYNIKLKRKYGSEDERFIAVFNLRDPGRPDAFRPDSD